MAKFRADKNCKIWAFWDQAFKGTFRGPLTNSVQRIDSDVLSPTGHDEVG